jgi:hypothetical protein
MDRLAKIDRDELVRRMRAAFERTMLEVTAAVNDAPDGHLIDGSEERCRDALGEFRRLAHETAVQMRVEATEADPSFPPYGPGARPPRAGEPDGAGLLRGDHGAPPPLRTPVRRRDRRAGG